MSDTNTTPAVPTTTTVSSIENTVKTDVTKEVTVVETEVKGFWAKYKTTIITSAIALVVGFILAKL